MKRVVILGAGTGGTMVANQLLRRLGDDWDLTVVDPEPLHIYQPGLLFVPFDKVDPTRLGRARKGTLRGRVDWVQQAVTAVEPESRTVLLGGGGRLRYDFLVLASGARTRPEETPGLLGPHWRRTAHDFYTIDGATALRDALAGFEGGRLVVDVVEMPIKCPVAPIEFLFLADEYFTRRGIRDRVELAFVTPLDGAFTRATCNRLLSGLLVKKGIAVETEFLTSEVDAEKGLVRSYDEREVPWDLLVSIPLHGGAPFVQVSDLGNELGFVPTERHSLLVKGQERIFALGDATDLPSSKAGSVAHFQSEVVVENLLRAMAGQSLDEGYDGHANCFIESGFGKGLLVDFNYDVEPLPGRYPLPGIGPFRLLEESRLNHWGKLAFEWIYWHRLLPGKHLPVPNQMSMRGKRLLAPEPEPAQPSAGG